jgi:NADPH:quinone reductase-like Zn-dependent oxidoreductase
MLAVTLQTPSFRQPLSAIAVGEHADPTPADGWAVVTLEASSLNHHDLWSMRGVGVQESWLPCVLGSDGAGIDDQGNEVIIYPILADPRAGGGDEMLDPGRRMLSDGIDGTLAERVAVPRANLIPKPASLSWEAAACLPTAWLTAYRMLFGAADLRPGATVLVQGAGGGLATAIIVLGRAAGLRVWVTSRSEDRIAQALELGADAGFAGGARLPERVDAVMESVGKATWAHSVKSLRPGGKLVVAGATSGTDFDPELSRIFLNRIQVLGTSMGTPEDLRRLVAFCDHAAIAPAVDSTFPLADAADGLRRMLDGDSFGKVVIVPS